MAPSSKEEGPVAQLDVPSAIAVRNKARTATATATATASTVMCARPLCSRRSCCSPACCCVRVVGPAQSAAIGYGVVMPFAVYLNDYLAVAYPLADGAPASI